MKNFKNSAFISTISCMLFLLTSYHSAAQKVNLSGTWMINKDKTDLGGAPSNVLCEKVVINQQPDSITITRITGGKPWSETLSLNGSIARVLTPNEERLQRNSKLIWDNQTLVEEVHNFYSSNNGTVDLKTTHKFKITEKNVLMVETVFERPEGIYTMKALYQKQ